MSTKARIAVVKEAGSNFEMVEGSIAEPGPHEVLIEVVAAGVCHTDLAVQNGDLPTNFPVVLGHEGSGRVMAVGGHVEGLAPGDNVVLSYGSCGHCRPCQEGDPAYCADFEALNFMNKRQGSDDPVYADGPNAAFFQQSSFATHAIAHQRNVVKIDGDIDISLLGPLGCGIQTGAGAVLRTAQPPAGSALLVSGVGSVGMSAVMAAKLAGCRTIIAVDMNEDRLALAQELGATHSIKVSKETDVAEKVREIVAEGVDYAIECSGNAKAARSAWSSLAKRGTLVVVGAPPSGTDYSFDANEQILSGRKIVGCVEGDAKVKQFIPTLVELYRQGRFPFDRLVERYPFEKINDAVADLHDGRVLKPILEMG
ncbi:NAD(P)-dependent alcohol dehydrogenase [Qipengyuania sp. XHP0207]|uniref:NAD(P)-dependent alcohol dehydrogenase n=1 Tax=Qipengyuania sp. XHP0207 TaxID=3038078 RepID=UPI00241E45A0|nr:NAD(P)-dependent alcohol dehydrogenase [Qipengyuania sp. XHP0207]MDG5746928.1 NAD(P)-dependent alcohol dehydrogenase [Qipengyuania sp. XHP0207]